MSTSARHGLQSCIDPWLQVEPRILRPKLATPPHNPADNSTHENKCGDRARGIEQSGGWSFLQALTNATSSSSSSFSSRTRDNEKDDKCIEYVHPMVKRSASILSEKSLEMCTESLGSETGDSTIFNIENDTTRFPFPFTFPCLCTYSTGETLHYQPAMEPREYGGEGGAGRGMKYSRGSSWRRRSFPPPLTTMSNGVQLIKGQAEDGRLMIRAVAAEETKACFKAVRTDGRLVLEWVDERDEEENADGDLGYAREEVEEDEAEEEDGGDEDGDHGYGDDEGEVEGVYESVGDENGVGAGIVGKVLTRPSRCKDDRETMVAWEHFWVASS